MITPAESRAEEQPPNQNTSAAAPIKPSRVPLFLQQVFLESNRGNEVHQPPPCGLASKTFFRGPLLRRLNSGIFRSDSFHSIFGRGGGGNNGNNSNSNKPTSAAPSCERSGDDDGGNTTNTDSSSSVSVSSRQEYRVATAVPTSPVRRSTSQPTSPISSIRMRFLSNSSTTSTTTNTIKKEETPVTPSPEPPACLSNSCSPQTFLDSLLRSRGYSTLRFKTLQTAYSSQPTALQLASYNVYLITLLRQHEVETFRAVMTSGISPNPCNKWGESLVHTICRRGEYEFVKVMICDAKTSVQVSDDHGRTPLHDALWNNTPSYETIKLLLDCDVNMLFLTDAHGATPLSYVRSTHWPACIDFIKRHADLYWPVLTKTQQHGQQPQPPLTQQEPNSRPIPDPKLALTLEMATMVSAGKITPAQAEYFCSVTSEDDDDEEEEGDSDISDSDDDDDDDDDAESTSSYSDCSSSSDMSWDEDEMADIMHSLSVPKVNAKPIVWSH
jgi:Ankyrin repeats (3 copies)